MVNRPRRIVFGRNIAHQKRLIDGKMTHGNTYRIFLIRSALKLGTEGVA